ncbi:MAG: precorrin-6y C5,15-methyltransferase (decarboxylating) subunit CbiE [Thermoguttaceae bacterium]|nr:precorrin-6y C5,15-methyltransferase (decarboxylating) subunit CbiE [Thermoguttaceae bacterium]MDW8036807.1 precorrin-6y C5,15-methyltransferase (decarboxylating) subunit CbiE [Thermoguttaceae bacterium]
MQQQMKVHIVGIGEDGLAGLTETARQILAQAELLIGEKHVLDLVAGSGAARLVVGPDLEPAVQEIARSPGKRIVVLAEGDPLFYGVARFLCDKLGKERFEVVPHVSTMQLAFARVKESWEDAFLTNLATHPLEQVLENIRTAEKVGLFTNDVYTPSVVAQCLLDQKIDYFTAYVCENLGAPNERVTRAELRDLVGQEFSPLNVMVLVRKPHLPDRPSDAIGRRIFGNPDEIFLQSKPKRGLLTPAEIRSIALAEMDLGPASIVWDVGAGSGSVAIEAAQLARQGTVYAIEMDPDDHQLILENAHRFGVTNLVPVLGRAPEAWSNLPDPDAVFVGGTGRGICRLVEAAYQRLRKAGRLVATMSSIDNLAETHHILHAHGLDVKVWLINIARGTYQLERIRFQALNPVFLVSIVKPL